MGKAEGGSWQNPRQPRGICHGFCWGKSERRHRGCLAACGLLWRAQSVRGLLHRRALRLPGRLFGAFRCYSAGRGQPRQGPFSRLMGQGQAVPIPWTQPRGRRSLYKHSAQPAVRGAACINAAPNLLFAAQPASTQRQTHCSRRSRLKFFAEAFFQKGWSAAD